MPTLMICPFCLRTISAEQSSEISCPDCGQTFSYDSVKKGGLVVDAALEAKEYATAKDYFANTEFLSASQHFKKALNANKNSYLSQYFIDLCDIYLHESTLEFDAISKVVSSVKSSTALLSRSSVKISDKLNFINAMLNEMKIIIKNCLRGNDFLYETDIVKYRKLKLSELTKLLDLFRVDNELLMLYSPQIREHMIDIADCAIAVCHKVVQTVAVGEDIFPPSDDVYSRVLSLYNDFCFFATSLGNNYDVKKYVPEFEQNDLIIEKVLSRFSKYDEKYRSDIKKGIITDPDEYASILKECEKAVQFTYNTCFRSLCDPMYEKRGELLKVGLKLLYRMLMPRAVIVNKKKIELTLGKYVDISDKISMLSSFLSDADKFDSYAKTSLREFYEKIYLMIDTYGRGEFDRYSKSVNKIKETHGADFQAYERLLLNIACCCAVSLKEFVPFESPRDKDRARVVHICKVVCDEFLLLNDYNINELEQSNIYRPMLDISNAVLKEVDE